MSLLELLLTYKVKLSQNYPEERNISHHRLPKALASAFHHELRKASPYISLEWLLDRQENCIKKVEKDVDPLN